eukprot:TRINITY_DN50540_c0_g1_i1.p1 TRINITY_DN50540_c0_g1~~TRINITY_DN50540_c0_g1_i1.p1  ORF type:complete len:136 (-),score=12.53 TRINITY_DN50540_c0_g1_i1:54-461(-)
MSGAGACVSNGIPSACIYSTVAAVGGVAACAALSSQLASKPLITRRYTCGLWGLATGCASGGLMLYLRGRKHVIPCHWPCYAGFVPPCVLAWWLADQGSNQPEASSKAGFISGFFASMLGGLAVVFYISPEDGRP